VTIYRQLPDKLKRKYDFTNVKSNVLNETFENEATTVISKEEEQKVDIVNEALSGLLDIINQEVK
jgi:hypothetical protein